jgi:hypothetical protein
MLVPLAITMLLTALILTEDPIFLYSKHKIEQCKGSLATIAKWNNTEDQLP